jgi:DNA-binding NtrC family response regulator
MKRVPFSRPQSERTILLADDEPAVRVLLTHVLERAGLRVLPAADGNEVLQQLRAAPEEIGLVLLDLNIPGPRGEQLLAALRGLRPEVPVVLMSGAARTDVAARFAAQGIAGCLEKPFRHDELLALIRAALQSETRAPGPGGD